MVTTLPRTVDLVGSGSSVPAGSGRRQELEFRGEGRVDHAAGQYLGSSGSVEFAKGGAVNTDTGDVWSWAACVTVVGVLVANPTLATPVVCKVVVCVVVIGVAVVGADDTNPTSMVPAGLS